MGYIADSILLRTPVGRVASAAGVTSIFTDLFSIFTTTDGTSGTTAKAMILGNFIPFGLNKTGDFSKEAATRIGVLTSHDIKNNDAD
ncbi:MAG: hypothetical protein HWE24_09415 [Oceanospirillaceae bacterium]|nr:hypothetical protein [Oceanospirillaceae bacterium]